MNLLHSQFGDVEVLVPSDDIKLDQAQWPEAALHGVRFVNAFSPWYNRYWVHLQRRIPVPATKRVEWPFPLPKNLKTLLSSVDAVLSVGGDLYSLDYGVPSILMAVNETAINLGTPVILWGASVGPFEANPYFKSVVSHHLSRMDMIAVRETTSSTYLRDELGLFNITNIPDPAFNLQPQKTDIVSIWPKTGCAGVLGFNISPLIQRYRSSEEVETVFLEEITGFIQQVVKDMDLSVLLIPHVIPRVNMVYDNDMHYMEGIIRRLGDMDGRVRLIEKPLNAAQTKYVISKCRFFIGARTHSTIAALSTMVPTISISYSVKARGINQDLFGHTGYVLETPEVNAKSLMRHLEKLQVNEADIRKELEDKIPMWRSHLKEGTVSLGRLIHKHDSVNVGI